MNGRQYGCWLPIVISLAFWAVILAVVAVVLRVLGIR